MLPEFFYSNHNRGQTVKGKRLKDAGERPFCCAPGEWAKKSVCCETCPGQVTILYTPAVWAAACLASGLPDFEAYISWSAASRISSRVLPSVHSATPILKPTSKFCRWPARF